MQETRKALIKDGWVVCSKCGHKLGRVVGSQSPKGLEIKCHSCKEINLVDKCKKWKEPKPKKLVQFKVPHCLHCQYYHEFTGNCILLVAGAMKNGSRASAKAYGSRTCKSFKPKEEYKENYKELKI
jgi:hypothetical protein